MTYTIGKLRREDFFEPDFDASIYFDLGARIFSTQWPPYVAHILQGLIDFIQSYFCQMQLLSCVTVQTWIFPSNRFHI